MDKKWKGYLTLEASFMMPMVLVLYLLVIMAGFFLYDRCVISQDHYLLALRGSRFTGASKDYGEVIYADMESNEFLQEYIEDRFNKKTAFYPFYQKEKGGARIEDDNIVIFSTGFSGLLSMEKRAEQINPVKLIKGIRGE